MDILEEIVARKRVDLEQMKARYTERTIHQEVEQLMQQGIAVPSMSQALKSSQTGIIAEFKRRSPSKGWIKEDADSAQIPLGYQQAGASALSILTDTPYFGGDDSDILKARKSEVTLPILYKNFVVDEYQLFQARLCGASAVLLIAACLKKDECRMLLNTFHTDVQTSFRLASHLPEEACRVSESGLKDLATLEALRLAGYNGFLMGERFMKEVDPARALKEFTGIITK